MIEINLLPGARKKKGSSGGSSLDVRAFAASLGERFKDPWMGLAVGGVALGLLAIGGMWYLQRSASATRVSGARLGWQQVKTRRSRSSSISLLLASASASLKSGVT